MTKTVSKQVKTSKIGKTGQKRPTPIGQTRQKIPQSLKLFIGSLRILVDNWKLFFGIVAIYSLLTAVLVQGMAAGNLNEIKSFVDEIFSDGMGQLAGSFTIFVYLLGTPGNSASPTASIYQIILGIAFSLAIIWALRQLHAGKTVRVRDGFYQGMTPIVPFIMVASVIVLQLLPLAVGTLLYSLVTANGIAASLVEQLVWGILAVALAAVSLRMLSSSLFALYIVTLPDMTPLAALRSASQLVRGRRWLILSKILFLPLMLLIVSGLLLIPIIMFATPLAAWAFYAITMLLLPVVHSYMYSLYRSLL